MKKIYKLLIALLCLPLCGLMCSCSENDDEVEEYPDWQNTNETYFNNLYEQTAAKIAAGDTSWKIYRCFSMPNDSVDLSAFDDPYTQKPEDCIVAHVEKTGKGTVTPLYTDICRVNYSGHLLPSTSYPSGLVFDKSFYGEFNEATAVPTALTVSSVVNGFATALMKMHAGDNWTVYIPYQLGYGTTAQSSIPAYSTLIFDISLISFYRPDADVPDYK